VRGSGNGSSPWRKAVTEGNVGNRGFPKSEERANEIAQRPPLDTKIPAKLQLVFLVSRDKLQSPTSVNLLFVI